MTLIQEYIEQKKIIQSYILEYINNENDSDINFQILIKCIEDQKILDDRNETRALLHLITKISNNYYRFPSFYNKIDQIFMFIKDSIIKYFTNSEIFSIFKSNKRILLFLFQEKILIPDKIIANIMIRQKYINFQYPNYFINEIKPFIPTVIMSKIKKQNLRKIEKNNLIPGNFEKCRKEGENEDYVCQLIRNDSIEEFVKFTNITALKLSSMVKTSIFETNSYLLRNNPTLIEYAAFFGSFQIFKYLQFNGVKLERSLWPYVIHGQNAELIHLLEENNIIPEEVNYGDCLIESIKCHSVNFIDYFNDNFIQKDFEIEMKNISLSLKYYNYFYFPSDLNNAIDFDYLCMYDYYKLVELLLSSPEIEINPEIIYKLFFFYL